MYSETVPLIALSLALLPYSARLRVGQRVLAPRDVGAAIPAHDRGGSGR